MLGKKKLSTEPYKGTRDFYPKEQYVQNHIFDVMSSTAESFGYSEYSSSILEPTELYKAKTNEEIVNEQTYSFEDRGGRSVTLRPEMTPSVARMVAAQKRELSFPLRWYSIPNVFRYERPQRGRLREHWQLNADIFGVAGIEAEVEIISLAYQIMKNFGANDDDFEMRINSRKSIFAEFDKRGIEGEKAKQLLALIDKKDKIDNFETESKKILGEVFQLNTLWDGAETLTTMLVTLGIKNVVYNPSIVRGFDYYTGMVFEVFDTSPENNRSLFGGGRYDNLLDIFGISSVPAVGFGMGDVTIRDFLETHNLLPEYASSTDLFICTTDKEKIPFAQTLAQKLRKEGLAVAVNFTDKKVGDQVSLADKQSVPFIICIGEKEVTQKEFTIKNLKTKEEKKLTEELIADYISGENN